MTKIRIEILSPNSGHPHPKEKKLIAALLAYFCDVDFDITLKVRRGKDVQHRKFFVSGMAKPCPGSNIRFLTLRPCKETDRDFVGGIRVMENVRFNLGTGTGVWECKPTPDKEGDS